MTAVTKGKAAITNGSARRIGIDRPRAGSYSGQMTTTTYHLYAIVNSVSFDAYVGCTTTLGRRYWHHTNRLDKGEHENKALQAAWNAFGAEAFQLVELLTLSNVAGALAREAERIWIAKIGTYNTNKSGNVWSETHAAQMREAMTRRWADPKRRAMHSKAIKSAWADPERRQAYDGRATRWDKPDEGKRHSQRMRELWSDPERRQKLEARRAARWSDPEAKIRQAEKMRAYHAARRERTSHSD